jgi:2-polyprenyl-6-methoxyphenol hydroxylase-like FAD-dependent oxidoreductase
VSARVVDAAPAPSDKSRALGVQAGTLELLGRVFGEALPAEMTAAGRPAREAFVHVDDLGPVRVDLSAVPSRFDFILILPQSETERLLAERLAAAGGAVERGLELVGLREEADGIVAALRRADGAVEEASFEFVAGCDGAHSAVRRAADIPFAGGAYVGDFILGDTALRWPWPYGAARPFINGQGVLACFPFKGERLYRVVMALKDAPPSDDAAVGLDEFRALASRLSGGAVRVESATWLTRFRVHHRMAERFRKGRVFLAGDAAHIHSPAGGQGMNTGIQDALNLGAKLANVLRGGPESLLDDYERERLPAARGVVRGTDFAFKLALCPESALARWARRQIFPRLLGARAIQRRVLRTMSQVDVGRREIERRDRLERPVLRA